MITVRPGWPLRMIVSKDLVLKPTRTFKLHRRADSEMKLSKLPDRTPVKMNILLAPSLAKRLREYADFYAETYGSKEEATELTPFMLEAFLDGYVAFKKGRKEPKQTLHQTTDRTRRSS